MSATGKIVFFCPPSDETSASDRLAQVIHYSGASKYSYLRRTTVPDREWEALLAADRDGTEFNGVPSESIERNLPLALLPTKYVAGCSLTVDFGGCPLSRRFYLGYQASVDGSVRGDFNPTDLIVTVGEHDLIRCTPEGDLERAAVSSFSVKFFGYGTPANWSAFEEAVFNTAETRQIRVELEALLGPVNVCTLFVI